VRTSFSSFLRLSLAACAAVIVSFAPVAADAAGLGRMTVLSSLGQPLNAEIELNATKDELSTMQVRIANADAYRRANLEYTAFVATVRLAIEQRRDGTMFLRVSSPRPVNDPFVELLVELVWSSGRLMREYTTLIDPPGFTPTDTVAPPVASGPAVKPAIIEPKVVGAPLAAPAAAPAAAAPVAAAAAEKPAPVAKPAARAPRAARGSEAAPEAPAAAAAAPGAAGADSYSVQRGDTLGRIAANVRPAGVSLDQMLVGLFRENKAAFDGNNMNRLRTGAVLRVPDAATVGATGNAEATREVRAQAADFNAYRQRVAGAVQEAPPVAEAGGSAASGKITAKVEEKVPAPAAGQDVLRLSKGDAAKGGAAKGAGTREEDVASRDKALREANERVAALEKMLNEAKRLLEVQSKQLAEMQKLAKAEPPKAAEPAKKAEPVKPEPAKPEPAKKAEPVKPEPAKPEPVKPEPVKPEPVKPEPVKPEPVKPEPVKPEAAKPEAPKPPEPKPEPAKPAPEAVTPPKPAPEVAPTAPVEVKPPVDAPKPKPIAPPPPPPPTLMEQALSFVQEYMVYLGGALAALLGLALVATRRRGKPAAAAAAAPAVVKKSGPVTDVPPPPPGLTMPPQNVARTDPMVSTQPGRMPGSGLPDEEVDPLAEADVYLRHGRDAQAESVLREAIARTPARHELRLKLLEIYMKRNDTRSFESVATELFAATGGQGPEWLKAAEMGATIDPANPLYAAGKASNDSSGANLATIAGVGVGAAAAAATAAAITTSGRSGSIDTEKTQILTVEDTKPAAEGPVDFDFEPVLPGTSTASDDPDATLLDAGAPGAPVATDMDFTLDFGSPDTASAPELPDLPLEPVLEGTQTSEADVDLQPVATGPVPGVVNDPLAMEQAEPVAASVATNVLLDSGPPTGSILDFKLEAARAEIEEAAARTIAGQPTLPPMAQDTMILANPGELVTFDMTHPAGLPQNWQETTLPRVDLDLGDSAESDGRNPNKDEHWNDVNTKYDLAKAYEEMGDKDGAREILREVIAEGDEQQKIEAEAMLARLG
jgi:pilus assembly protein FimV